MNIEFWTKVSLILSMTGSAFQVAREFKSAKKGVTKAKIKNTVRDICIHLMYFIMCFAAPLFTIISLWFGDLSFSLLFKLLVSIIAIFDIVVYIGFIIFTRRILEIFKNNKLKKY